MPGNVRAHFKMTFSHAAGVAAVAGVCTLLAAAGVAAPAATASAQGATVPTHRIAGGTPLLRPGSATGKIALFAIAPSELPATGGHVELTSVVAGTSTCTISAVPAISTLPSTESCGTGSRRVAVKVPANSSRKAVTYRFTLEARGTDTSRASSSVTVLERGRTPRPGAPRVTLDPTSASVVTGSVVRFSARASGTPSPTVQWQSSAAGTTTWSNIHGAESTVYSIVAETTDSGLRVRAVFTNRLGAAVSTAATLTVGASAVAPVVTTEPASVTVTAGTPVTFTSTATGVPTPSETWEVSSDGGTTWVPLPGGSGSSYFLVASTAENGEEFQATFSNSAGSVTSADATLTVTAPVTTTTTPPGGSAPQVTSEPSSITVASGATASFSAAASGTPTPTVAWSVSTNSGASWSAISGATSATYTFTATSTENGWEYEATFTNRFGSVTTSPATLGVTTPQAVAPSVILSPSSLTVTGGSTAAFNAGATGTPTPSVAWSVSTNSGASWSTISGATSTTYAFTATSSESGWEFQATFTNAGGSATTAPATLTVTTATTVAPVVTTEPENVSAPANTTASFSAAASGTPTPSVAWSVSTNSGASWSAISGATSATYTFTATSAENGWEYEATFTNSAGSATTIPALLSVTSALGESTNWSGYDVTGATFSAVAGSWTVPTVTCASGATTYASEWVGIDGAVSDTVEQDGTETDCINGSPSYDAWYEMYGDSSVNDGYEVALSTSSYPVAPGDVMDGSISLSGSTWTLSIADTTKGWSYAKTVANYAPAPAQSSAEWILERPTVCANYTCSQSALATLTTTSAVTFTSAAATASGTSAPVSNYTDTAIAMVTGGSSSTTLATPGALSSGGGTFTVSDG